VEGASLLGTLKDIYRVALETGVFLHGGPVGCHGGDVLYRGLKENGEILFNQETLFVGESESYVKDGPGYGKLSPRSPRGGPWRGGGVRLPGTLRDSNI
jgi:hypothetical protein